jgi:hypothetical protein
MLSQRTRPRAYHHIDPMLGPGSFRMVVDTIEGTTAGAVERMPTHPCRVPEVVLLGA